MDFERSSIVEPAPTCFKFIVASNFTDAKCTTILNRRQNVMDEGLKDRMKRFKSDHKCSSIMLGVILISLSPLAVGGSIFKCKEMNSQDEVVTVFSQVPCANNAQETASEGLGTSKGGKFGPQQKADRVNAKPKPAPGSTSKPGSEAKQNKTSGGSKKKGYKRAIDSARNASSQPSTSQ